MACVGSEKRAAFVPIGAIASGILRELIGCIEPSSQQARHLSGPGFRTHVAELDRLSRAAQLFAPVSARSDSAKKSDSIPLNPILLFGGIGLLALLIAVVTGVQGVWY
jgi:hypothetical protein